MTIRGLVIAGGLLFGAMGSSFAVVVVLAIVDGRYRLAASLVGLTIMYLGGAAASVKYGSNRISPRMTVDGAGTTLRPDRLLDIPLVIVFLGVILNFASQLFLPSSDGWFAAIPPWLKVALGLVGAVFVVILMISLWSFFRWGASTYLRLTPAGVEIGQGLRPRSYTWDRVGDVTDQVPRARRRMISSLVVVNSDGKALTVLAGNFTPHGAALRDMVTFYWRHPEARGELTDGSAPMRLQQSLIRR